MSPILYNMRLDADLMVPSACQTALGTEIGGEGLVGLARAFIAVGVAERSGFLSSAVQVMFARTAHRMLPYAVAFVACQVT